MQRTKNFCYPRDQTIIDRYNTYGSVCFRNTSCFTSAAKCEFVDDKKIFSSSGQYFTWKKIKLFENEDLAIRILETNVPVEHKYYSMQIKGFDKCKWDKYKIQFMYEACYYKFSQNSLLQKELIDTGEKVLVNLLPKDNTWGVGLSVSRKAQDPRNWLGENYLGLILMRVRDDLKNL